MRTVTLVFVAATLALAGPVDAKPKKKDKAAAKPPAAAQFKPVGGPLPPLPQPTELSLAFEAEANDEFAIGVSAAANEITAPTATLAWTLGDWRTQLAKDVKRVALYKKWFADTLEKSQREDFQVAVRYLRGVYASASQFADLAEQTQAEFDAAFPADRNLEISHEPPEASRRVRMYLDKVNVLHASARAFLARSVQGKQEKIVRIE